MEINIREVERAVLYLLMKEEYVLKSNLSSIKEDWMRTKQRRYILNKIRENYSLVGTLIGNVVFKNHVKADFDEDIAETYLCEWQEIEKMHVSDSIQSLIEELKKEEQRKKLTELLNQASNLILEENRVEEAISLIQQRAVYLNNTTIEELPIVEFNDYKAREELIIEKKTHPDKFLGIPSGFKRFDNETGGFFGAELYIVAALSGVGKSTFMKMLTFNMIANGYNVLHITNEENSLQVQNKYDAVFSNIDYKKFKRASISQEEIDAWKNCLEKFDKNSKVGKLYIKEIMQGSNASFIEKTVWELRQKGIHIDCIVLDYLDHMGSIFPAFNENDAMGKAAGDLKQLSINTNLPVVTATQMATASEAKQKKKTELSRNDVYGSKQKTHKANMLIYISHEADVTDQLESNGGDRRDAYDCDKIWKISIAKNRDGPCFAFFAQQEVKTGRVIELERKEGEEDKTIPVDLSWIFLEDEEEETEDEVKEIIF